MTIYDYLFKQRRPHLIAPSREYNYFQENSQLLYEVPDFLPYVNPKDEFSIILSNLIIEGVKSFHTILKWQEEGRKTSIEEVLPPFFKYQDVAIYCPLLSVSNNLLLANHRISKLIIEVDAINSFETYNFMLFDSALTSFVYLGKDEHTKAYYHYDFHTIYIINDQGQLDVRISLFDRDIVKPDFRNIIERLKPVVDAYYNLGRSDFLKTLKEQKLISSKAYTKLVTMRKGK